MPAARTICHPERSVLGPRASGVSVAKDLRLLFFLHKQLTQKLLSGHGFSRAECLQPARSVILSGAWLGPRASGVSVAKDLRLLFFLYQGKASSECIRSFVSGHGFSRAECLQLVRSVILSGACLGPRASGVSVARICGCFFSCIKGMALSECIRSFVSGHGFSRAEWTANKFGALAPEGVLIPCHAMPSRWRGSLKN